MTVFPLGPLCEELRLAALDVSGQEAEPALVAARFMDGLRDAGVPLPDANAWNGATGALVGDEWARLEVLTRAMRDGKSAPQVAECLHADPSRALKAFPEFVTREAQLLTIELLLKSPFRVEELARKWIAALGGRIEGESERESRDRMERLDFGGVLKNLKAADADRGARMKKLKELEAKRLQEQQEAYARAGRE